jgi:mannose-6-phosphate isomerase-like protein (cupin superfamily)
MLLISAVDAVALLIKASENRGMTFTHNITTTDGYAMPAGEGERLWIVGDTMTLKATGDSTGGRLLLLENLNSPGGGPPPHVHTGEDEFFYVLDGAFEIRIGDDVHRVGAGGFAYVPRGTVHNFRNIAESPSRILIGFTPAGMEGFFRDSGRPALDDGPAPPIDDDEISRTMVAAQQYGVEAVAFED